MVLLASLLTVLFGLSIQAATASAASPAPTPSRTRPQRDNGTTIDPLQYNCGNDAPTCGQVGESNGYYNGTNVDLLYSENYYCDANVASHAATGCEVGAVLRHAERHVGRSSGTSLGTHPRRHLYIPVPLFANPPATQCTATATCIDHPRPSTCRPSPPTCRESTPSSLYNVPIPAHDHVSAHGTTACPNGGTSSRGHHECLDLQHAHQRQRHPRGHHRWHRHRAPTNAFLFFQVLPGTLSAAMAADLTATAPPGPAVATAPNPDPTVTRPRPAPRSTT